MKPTQKDLWIVIAFIMLTVTLFIINHKRNKCNKDYELVSSAMVWYTNPNYTLNDQVICITDKSLIEWKVEKQTNDLLFVNSGTGERMQKHSCQKVDTFNYNQ